MQNIPRICNDIKTWLGEFWVVATKPALDALALFGGIAGVASAYLGTDAPDDAVRAFAESAVWASVLLFLLSLAVICGYAAWRVRQRTSTQIVPFAHNTYLHVISGDGYIENLEELNRSLGGEDKDVVCVCGLSNQGSLGHLTRGSVVRDLMSRIVIQTSERTEDEVKAMGAEELAGQHAISLLQGQLEREKALITKGRDKQDLEYGDCLIVSYDQDEMQDPSASAHSGNFSEDFPKKFRILFLVNCRENTEAAVSDPDAIKGPDSSSLMHYVFERLDDEHLDLLFMPVLGTNRLHNSHQSVITSIVQRYCSHVPAARRYYDLVISVREKSMGWDGLSLVRLRRYIKEALRFYD